MSHSITHESMNELFTKTLYIYIYIYEREWKRERERERERERKGGGEGEKGLIIRKLKQHNAIISRLHGNQTVLKN